MDTSSQRPEGHCSLHTLQKDRSEVASVHQLAREIDEGFGLGASGLLQVGAGAVTAFGDLVVEERLVELFHACRELAGVLRADAIVAGGGEDKRLRILRAGFELVVGRDAGKTRPLLRDL